MRQVVGLFVAAGLVATACGSSSDTDSSAGAESPLAEFLGVDLGIGNSEDQEAAFEEQQRVVNEKVTACMSAEGFEWLPDPDQAISFLDENEEGLEWGSKEWTAKYGFGISTQSFSQSAIGPDLLGWDDAEMMGGEDYVDPNQDYLETLSQAEQDAFYEALYGSEEDFGPEWDDTLSEAENNAAMDEYYENEYVPSGCMNVAQEEVFEGEFAVYEQFADELDEMYERIEADPRIAEAEGKVSSCVADKGFTYTDMDDVYTTFDERLQPIYNAQETAYMTMEDPFAGLSEEEMAALTEEDFMAFDQGEPPLPDDMRELLGEIQTDEIALAVAVDDCGGGWANQENLYIEVSAEYEEQFIDDNREALEAAKSDN